MFKHNTIIRKLREHDYFCRGYNVGLSWRFLKKFTQIKIIKFKFFYVDFVTKDVVFGALIHFF